MSHYIKLAKKCLLFVGDGETYPSILKLAQVPVLDPMKAPRMLTH